MTRFTPHSECVKCGSKEAEARWLDKQTILGAFHIPESIERTCIRCGYVWWQKPKDAP